MQTNFKTTFANKTNHNGSTAKIKMSVTTLLLFPLMGVLTSCSPLNESKKIMD
jgi:hypothetical protein